MRRFRCLQGPAQSAELSKPELREGDQNAGAAPSDKMSGVGIFEATLSFLGRGDNVFNRPAADKTVDVSGNIARATLDGSIGPWCASEAS
jgi:hypothetical protein